MTMKLKVSDTVTFDVAFALNDAGAEREYGFKASAKRQKPDQEGETIGDFLNGRAQLRMLAWSDPKAVPLADENGDVAAGPQALAALYDQVGNMAGIVYAAYLQATNAKARLGNSNG